MAGTHIKSGGFGLIPLGVRMTYYCPVHNEKVKLKADVKDGCPICGQRVNWSRQR